MHADFSHAIPASEADMIQSWTASLEYAQVPLDRLEYFYLTACSFRAKNGRGSWMPTVWDIVGEWNAEQAEKSGEERIKATERYLAEEEARHSAPRPGNVSPALLNWRGRSERTAQ